MELSLATWVFIQHIRNSCRIYYITLPCSCWKVFVSLQKVCTFIVFLNIFRTTIIRKILNLILHFKSFFLACFWLLINYFSLDHLFKISQNKHLCLTDINGYVILTQYKEFPRMSFRRDK